ncbi:MAG: gamma-glutamyltransferase family protein [Thermodesulfobacteriota bacterium]
MFEISSWSPGEMRFGSRRSPVLSRGGMVAAGQPAAVEAGLAMLRAGGAAADAAVAAAAVLAVVEPCSTGLGGDVFALYLDAASGEAAALNGSGRSPAALDLAAARARGCTGRELPLRSALTVTAPGACAAWCDLSERFGRLPLDRVLEPARDLAARGFVVHPVAAAAWARGEEVLRAAPGGGELLPGGRAPRPGQVVRNPGLALVLERLGAAGPRGARDLFYRGEVAEAVVRAVREAGGLLAMSDLAGHASQWAAPIGTDYRGVRVLQCPPNGQGLAVLLALDILARLDPAVLGRPLSPERVHAQAEALRLAFADARAWVADPNAAPAPLDVLLSREYGERRAALVRPDRALPAALAGLPLHGPGTVQFVAVDGAGNACSMVNSNYLGFGTGIVPQGLGFSLQNRGHNFSLEPGHPNCLAPGRRPYHTIIPGLALRPDGSLYAAFGVMGAFMQPQGQVQVLSALLDDGLDPQAALDLPRFCLEEAGGGTLALEAHLPAGLGRALERRGHRVRRAGAEETALFGRGQVIARSPEGVLCGGSDPRADGCALGLG